MVVISKLSDAEKETYFEFLLENNVTFSKADNNYYVANVQMVVRADDPEDNKSAATKRSRAKQRQRTRKLAQGQSVKIFGRRASRPPQEMARVVSAIASSKSLFDYSCYPKFSSLVTMRDSLRPRRRHYAWLMKMIEEIYDHRYEHDTMDLRNSEKSADYKAPEEGVDRLSNIFPVFVVDFLSKRFGLRSLVDQHAWDLLYNIHALRTSHLEVELFARFLEEYYDPDDLLFFLYVRSVAQKELMVNFVNRWTSAARGRERMPKPILLTYRECQVVARVVFGSDSDPLYRSFMHMIDNHIRGRKKGKHDTRRMEVYQFLHVALVGYHETRPAEDEEEIAAAEAVEASAVAGGDFSAGHVLVASREEQERLYREAEQEYEARMSKLADAQLTADSKIEQDLDREMRVQEMEDAINRAADARRDAQSAGVFGQATGSGNVRQWAQAAMAQEAEVQQASDLAEAHARAENEAQLQREALARARAGSIEAQKKAEDLGNMGPGVTQDGMQPMDTRNLDDFIATISRDREAIERMEAELLRPQGSPPAAAAPSSNAVVLQQLGMDLSVPMEKTKQGYLAVLMESCSTLPEQVVQEIRNEVSKLLDAKIAEKVRGAEEACLQGSVGAAKPLPQGPPSQGDLAAAFKHLINSTAAETGQPISTDRAMALDTFCRGVVQMQDLREKIEPMVALLASYATTRLNENQSQ